MISESRVLFTLIIQKKAMTVVGTKEMMKGVHFDAKVESNQDGAVGQGANSANLVSPDRHANYWYGSHFYALRYVECGLYPYA
jgi:hypothetical protein